MQFYLDLPDYVQIEPVGQCNLRCTMCPIPFRQDGPPYGPPAFMEWTMFTRILDEFENLKHLHLQGLGEPMMHPRSFDMVEYSANKGIQVTTNSNFTLLNVQRADRLVTGGLDILHISVDAATPELYERIRVRSHWERLMQSFELLFAAQARHQTSMPHLHLVMVIMGQNLHELPGLVRRAHDWQMEEIWVQHLAHDFKEASLPERYAPMRQFVDEQTLLNEDLERIQLYFGQAEAVAHELGIRLRLPTPRARTIPPGTPGRERCSWPLTGAYISYQGLAMPCCMVATPDRINFGNMGKGGATAVWNNSAFQNFRRQLEAGPPPEICASCSVYSHTF